MNFRMWELYANPNLLAKSKPPRGVLRHPKGGDNPQTPTRIGQFIYFQQILMDFEMLPLYAALTLLTKFQLPKGVLRPLTGG